MKSPLRAAAALLAFPLALVAQTPAPTKAPSAGTFDAGKSYTGVRQQQGRVQTDADWNEKVAACQRENAALRKQLEALRAENASLTRRLTAPAVPVIARTPAPK